MSRNKLYALIIIACAAGYSWLFFNYSRVYTDYSISVCLIKQATNIPCPSCGSTRSVMSVLQGRFTEAIFWNPIGVLLAIIMLISPIWIAYDYLRNGDSLFIFYKKIEKILQQKKVAIPIILLLIINWMWNIYKGL